ncbi:pentatricopeptide repeat-containing protein ELI1, chloroplastic-like [Phoenix dactylifera]|uniref:Pentatricopeptide repeat-containing protein ELI1, chloroplastic-like n=1 Tax=Phoenix dactylifera TaxID=42345 RepID=A0A8B7CBS3_PHODC|nr:pentatricopeptide repeat-containing protein ELI1, chloroplastic-like [Phoenix dactylifera]
MAALQNQELLRLTRAPLSHFFLSASASAIRKASSHDEALRLFKLRFQRRRPGLEPFETHAAVFTLKASSSAPLVVPHLHAHFLKSGLFADVHVASALLHNYALSSFSLARLLVDEIPNGNIVTANTMLTCYSRHGRLGEARSLFNSMKEKDIVSWSAMIGGYMDAGHRTHGLALFREMMKAGHPKPDPLMLVTLLSGCASTGSLRLLGKSIHAYAEKNGIEVNVQLGTSLIDMYARSGCLISAFRVFERMRERNVMHWTAMICGLAMHGHGKEAVAFFDRMREVGVRPNEITFTGVLSACCHAGLIEEGQRYFCSMVEEFGYKPQIHHYGCMVDLFAKAGRLEDAYAIIESMRMEPNIIVWTCFLAACKKYKNFEIAEKGIEKVLSMAIPNEDGGVYALISDLYALGGRWNDVERVRKLMDKHSVKKSRGSSFLEVEEKGR